MEKGLDCVGVVGTAGLPTAAGSGLVKLGKFASCDLPSPFLLGGWVRGWGGAHTFPPSPHADSAAPWVDGQVQ